MSILPPETDSDELTDNNHQTDTSNNSQTKTKRSVPEWCVDNPMWAVFIGICIIFLGVITKVLAERYHHHINETGHLIITIFGHGFIIAGEALAILFFLHHTVEKKSIAHNRRVLKEGSDHIKTQFTKIMTNSANHASMQQNKQAAITQAAFDKQAAATETAFNNFINKFEKNAEKRIHDIQNDLFKGLLQGMKIMPAEMVDQLKNAEYNAALVRRNLKIRYSHRYDEDGRVVIKQDLSFEIENISGDKEVYNMPLNLNDTNFVSYEFKEASCTIGVGRGEKVKKYLPKNFNNKVNGELPNTPFADINGVAHRTNFLRLDGDDLIDINPGETIRVNKYVYGNFDFNGKETVSDNYYSMLYTLGIEIVAEFPKHLDFDLLPTSPVKDLKIREEGEIKTFKFPFLMPGQGFYFTIQKKA